MKSKFNFMCYCHTHLNRSASGLKNLPKDFFLAIQLIVSIIMLFSTSCKKFVEVDAPVTNVTGASVYHNDATAAAVLTGIYTNMSASGPASGLSINCVSLLGGLSSDELILYSGVTDDHLLYYKNNLSASTGLDAWRFPYQTIYIINSAIEGLTETNDLTASVKQQLLGEAKFMRAFYYFYLVNLYGEVPLALTTDYKINRLLRNSSKTIVWKQVISDLIEAKALLNEKYVGADAVTTTTATGRVRPNKWVATALLARAYLYNGEYENAEKEATLVINNTSLYKLTSLNEVFLKNSLESIWQLQPVNNGWNAEEARLFIIQDSGPNDYENIVYLSDDIVNSFQKGDQRKMKWIASLSLGGETYYYPYKYKIAIQGSPVTEYSTVLRLGEQYLIRAEARIQQNNVADGISDLNILRDRATDKNTPIPEQLAPINSVKLKSEALLDVEHERQVELFTEWGHRWLDLKRTGRVDVVMPNVAIRKGGAWDTNWQLYPIPLGELQQDPNLKQNVGY